jgi:hypothetical protein
MRKTTLSLLALFVCSLAVNVLLLNRVNAAEKRAGQIVMTVQHYTRFVKEYGSGKADQDFAAGQPYYYAFGWILGPQTKLPIGKDRSGRVVYGLGEFVFEPDRIFAESYNQRMDQLFASRPRQQDLEH